MACQARPVSPGHGREPLETQIRRFPRSYRRRLRKLVRGSSRLGQLLYTFPGLAFLLVAGGRAHAARGEAVKLIKNGEPLSVATAAVDLPSWMRRLPPEAFTEVLGTVPGSDSFSRSIVNEIPADADKTAMWLRFVLFAAESCDEDFALWIARQRLYACEEWGRIPLLPLAAFAWFSREERMPARGLIRKPWHCNLSFAAAVEEMRSWVERIVLDYCREDSGRNGSWFKTRKACGYRFAPLLTPEDLQNEGQRMNNCVATYAHKVASGDCLIYSIRRGSERVATLEITSGQGAPVIAQLLAAGNTKASEDVWRAASVWLSKQGQYPFATRQAMARAPIVASRWDAIWRPYCEEKLRFRPLLAEPTMRTLVDLRQDIGVLGRLAKRQ